MFPSLRVVLLAFLFLAALVPAIAADEPDPPPEIGGQLLVFDMNDGSAHLGSCPLKHTDVHATIFGYVVRATLRQTFENTFDRPIEAKYIFPLPNNSAVDEMTMIIGDRRIVGEIHERKEATRIYEEAKAEGHTASLLNEERPNCFTQRIANIEPGAEIVIEISYIETIASRDGVYEWTFPMVAGPRYVPMVSNEDGSPTVDNTRVVDAPAVVPPTMPPDMRAGHTISLSADILGTGKIRNVQSVLHDVDVIRTHDSSVRVSLKDSDEIPNQDFILRWQNVTEQIAEGLFVDEDDQGAYFTLLLQPPARIAPEHILPREVIFVIDASGSMHGAPIAQAGRTMKKCLETLGPDDTFNLLAFSSQTQSCFDDVVPSTPENLKKAFEYLDGLEAYGGTEMMPAVESALGGKHDPSRLRVVCFMTDGYIGYEYELLSAIQKNVDTSRIFSFGIGNGVNRFLLDEMAHLGRGAASYVTLGADSQQAADQFLMRIHAPVLTDISIDWGTLPAADVTPAHVSDLFAETPIMVHGRLTKSLAELANAKITIHGRTASGPYERQVALTPKKSDDDMSFIPKLWTRGRIADLMLTDLEAAQYGEVPDEIRQQIIDLSVSHRVLSEYTAFVAVEKRVKVDPATGLEVPVPVEMPQGLAPTATQDWAFLFGGSLMLLAGGLLILFGRGRHALA